MNQLAGNSTKRMRVAVIGSNGMLGSQMVRACYGAGFDVSEFDLPLYDILGVGTTWTPSVPKADWVVNCAAYTDVNRAEVEPTRAFQVNAIGAGRLAEHCRISGVRLLHISTDYVFDGEGCKIYREDSDTNPVNMYGRSKLAGEILVRAELPEALIVRTQSLFGKGGRNFVKTIAEKIFMVGEKNLRVVCDQVSSPTYVNQLSAALIGLMIQGVSGTVHATSLGYCSWSAFARAIVEELGVDGVTVEDIFSSDMVGVARRPKFSVLNGDRLRAGTGPYMGTWKEGLRAYAQTEDISRMRELRDCAGKA